MPIPHNMPTLGFKELLSANRVIYSRWLAQGDEVKKFENQLCDYLNLPEGHAVAVSSGTAALYLALWALKGKGKAIGLPVYSCASLRNAIGMIGGQAKYYDCEKDSPNIDTLSIRSNDLDILIAPSIFGIPTRLPNDTSIKIVEDIAQSIGATVKGEKIGLRGDLGICSFYATKLITSGGQGGAIISRHKEIIDHIRDYREFDCRNDANLRFNFQMTDLQASIGRVQLARLPGFIQKRQNLFEIYQENGISLFGDSLMKDIVPVRYRAVLKSNNQKKIIEKLSDNKIKAIVPIEKWELLDLASNYPAAEDHAIKAISIPIYPNLSYKEAKLIGKIVKEAK